MQFSLKLGIERESSILELLKKLFDEELGEKGSKGDPFSFS